MNYTEETFFSLNLPYQEQLTLQRACYRGGEGPRVAIASGIHGDELEGLYVCHRVAQWLESLEEGVLLGSVELYPALNPLGLDTLERFVPTHGVDLNRNFPGHPNGLLPQRMTHAIIQALAGCCLVVDIHASNIYLREIPQVRINQDFSANLIPLAQTMNLDVIWIHAAATVLETTLAHSLNDQKTSCLVVEMGVGMRVTPHFCEQLFIGLLHTWQKLGVLAPDYPLPPLKHTPIIADDNNVCYLNAQTSGMFVPQIEHWSQVEKNQLLGHIISPLHGKSLAEVRSPVSGTLFTLREYPLVYEGSLMARIINTDPGD